MLKANDVVTICYSRSIMGKEFSQQSLGVVAKIEQSLADVLIDIGGRSERVTIPVNDLIGGRVSCDTCIHRLQKITTDMCPAKYEQRSQFKNATDRTCDSAISDVSNHRLSDFKDCT